MGSPRWCSSQVFERLRLKNYTHNSRVQQKQRIGGSFYPPQPEGYAVKHTPPMEALYKISKGAVKIPLMTMSSHVKIMSSHIKMRILRTSNVNSARYAFADFKRINKLFMFIFP